MTFEEWYNSKEWWKNRKDSWEAVWDNMVVSSDPAFLNTHEIGSILDDIISLVRDEYGD